jgi:hypothetical protein
MGSNPAGSNADFLDEVKTEIYQVPIMVQIARQAIVPLASCHFPVHILLSTEQSGNPSPCAFLSGLWRPTFNQWKADRRQFGKRRYLESLNTISYKTVKYLIQISSFHKTLNKKTWHVASICVCLFVYETFGSVENTDGNFKCVSAYACFTYVFSAILLISFIS